jgi:iron-sulfur cluster assembly protein
MIIKKNVKLLKMNIITISDNAAEQIKKLLAKRELPAAGIRVKVKSGGCSGLSYVIEYADSKQDHDEIITDKGVTVFIDPKAVLFLMGSEMDFMEEQFKSGFKFTNPNEKGNCGCGKSFHV